MVDIIPFSIYNTFNPNVSQSITKEGIFMTRTKTKDLTLTAMMAAVICVLAPISIPIPVSSMPLSLGTFALYLTAYVLKPKMAFAATALYLLMGAVGLPVFAGYSAGFSRFAGAGGGYLTGSLFLVPACSICIRRFPQSPVVQIIGMLLATFLFYAYATYWMSAVIGGSFIATLPAGALVFLPLDSVKILVTCWIGRKLQTYLENAA